MLAIELTSSRLICQGTARWCWSKSRIWAALRFEWNVREIPIIFYNYRVSATHTIDSEPPLAIGFVMIPCPTKQWFWIRWVLSCAYSSPSYRFNQGAIQSAATVTLLEKASKESDLYAQTRSPCANGWVTKPELSQMNLNHLLISKPSIAGDSRAKLAQ